MSTPPVAPRFVPTLTEVVEWQPEEAAAPAPQQPAAPGAPGSGASAADAAAVLALQEHIVSSVLGRVEHSLPGRLSEAIAQVVMEQTRFMLPRLREEIAEAVRHSVADALREELGSGPSSSAG
ncbi:hypothetical protein [Xylophilus sp. ASV27]|uniref:hypothetical protein n=1 Tax=Xylophilus sp. ASV27 TaxID=2795129 RepID=UPI0018ED1785|nr:hypothetical protein [Xylophilus sp. ASV27]